MGKITKQDIIDLAAALDKHSSPPQNIFYLSQDQIDHFNFLDTASQEEIDEYYRVAKIKRDKEYKEEMIILFGDKGKEKELFLWLNEKYSKANSHMSCVNFYPNSYTYNWHIGYYGSDDEYYTQLSYTKNGYSLTSSDDYGYDKITHFENVKWNEVKEMIKQFEKSRL